MVKGLSRQVIVVKNPDPDYFEQAIFILKDDALQKEGMTERAVLRQARQAAQGCAGVNYRPGWNRQLLWSAIGAGATGAAWILSVLL